MGFFSLPLWLPKLSKTCKNGEFFCPRCCWVKYWNIKLVKIQYFTFKKSVFFKTAKFAVSAWSIDQKTPENPQNLVKKGQKCNIFWKSTLLYRGFSQIGVLLYFFFCYLVKSKRLVNFLSRFWWKACFPSLQHSWTSAPVRFWAWPIDLGLTMYVQRSL